MRSSSDSPAATRALELRRFRAQLIVRERLHGGLELVDAIDNRAQPLQFAIVLGAEDFGEKLANH